MDTESGKGADEDFSLYADVTDTSYFDFRQVADEVAVRVYQLNNAGVAKTMCVDLVQISFVPQYQSKYNASGNRYKAKYNSATSRYKDKYTSKEQKYRPKHPHKNPQDDYENPHD